MTKFKRRMQLLSLAVPMTAIVPLTSISVNANSGQIYFDNRKFNSLDEAMAYLVQNEKIIVGQQKVLGDIERSYINSETGLLNKSLLPNYDASKMHFAYKNAGGGITKDYQKAKNSYFNPGTVVSMYDDGYGNNTFLSEKDAENSMRSKSIVSRMGFYNVNYVDSNLNGDLFSIPKRLNPFNMTDINNYKNNIKEHIFDIIANNLKMDSPKSSGGDYLITDFKPSNKTTSSSKQDQDPVGMIPVVAEAIKKYGNGWKMNEKGEITKTAQNQVVNVKLESKGMKLSHTYWSGEWNGSWHKYGARMANHGTRWTWRSPSSPAIMDAKEFKSFFNDPNSSASSGIFIRDDSRVQSLPIDLKTRKEIQEICKKIQGLFSQANVETTNSNKMAFKQEALKKEIWKKISSKSNSVNLIEKNLNSDLFTLTSLPNLKVEGWNVGLFGYWNFAQVVNIPGGYNFKYKRKINLKFNSPTLGADQNPEKLLTKLLEWTDKKTTYTFKVKRFGHSLFDVKIGIDQNEKMVVKSIELSKDNHENSGLPIPTSKESQIFKSFNNIPLNNIKKLKLPGVSPGITASKYFYWLLKKFNEELNNVGTKKDTLTTLDIFNKYFGDQNKYFGLAKKNIRYKFDTDFSPSRPGNPKTIETQDILKMYVNIIDEAYEKYKDIPELLKIMSKRIVGPENILIYKINKKYSLLNFGKYIIKSISEFNASVSSGALSTVEGMASNGNEWNGIKSSVKYNPAHLLVAYDNNGQQVNVGDYKYDNQLLLKFNILLNKEPKRDYQHVYVGNQLVENTVTTIHSLRIEETMYYFKNFKDVKKFMLKYIKEHSVQI